MQEIEVRVDPQGKVTVGWCDLLEDYWADYLAFREEAIRYPQNGDIRRTHRYLRSSLFASLNYLSGLANRWEGSIPGLETNPSSNIAIFDRLTGIADHFHAPHAPENDVTFLTGLASRCANLQPIDEKPLLRAFSLQEVDSATSRVVAWLVDFVKESGLVLHSEAKAAAFEYARALGTVSKEKYSSFESVKDDPLAFQDPPGMWEQYEAGRDSNGKAD